MRYDDASQAGSATDHVSAHDDTAQLAGNDFGQTTGNIITGTGTVSGSAGADISGPGAHITAISGAGGSDDSFDANGHLVVAGQYGTLTIDANGNYSYARNAGSPEGVSDTFTYTLADAAGSSDQAKLVIAIGNPPILNAQGSQTIQTANGAVVLPAGVELSDVHVQGRDLVITLPDGSTMVIPDGAVFVPQLVVNGVEVPASNLAALLIDSEPKPAAGDQGPNQLSSGGNFEVPVAPLDPGVPLGDLIPPTELHYTPPEVHELFPPVQNQEPIIGVSAVNVSDEGVSSVDTPNPDNVGSPDTTNNRINSGILPVSDPDGDPLTVTLTAPTESLTSQGTAITWSVSPDGQTVTGTAGANVVITVHIDFIDAAGAHYTVTQSRPIDHPVHGSEDGVSFVVGATVSDGQATTIGGAITVTVEDDSPTITGQISEPTLVVDDTTLLVNASASFSGVAVTHFGADGPAGANALVWSLSTPGGASGIIDVATGEQVNLTLNGGVVEGRTATTNQLVFTVSVDGSGLVTLDQIRAVQHNDPTDPDEPGASAATLSSDGLIKLNLVATDRDGDSASISVDIGQNLQFKDDGPSIATNSASEPNLVVDETNLAADASASFAGLFTQGNYGNDGAGSTGYAVTTVNGTDSGLVDTLTGQHIFLYNDGTGGVVGRVGTGGVADSNGAVAFAVTVNGSGVVTLDQSRAIFHTPDSGPDQPSATITDSAIQLVATITDRDGDQASASVNIGSNLTMKDDAPHIGASSGTEPTITVDETNLATNASASFAGFLGAAGAGYGADGAGTTAYALHVGAGGVASGLFDVATGNQIYLYDVGGTIVGKVGSGPATADSNGATSFTVSVDSNGLVTLDQVLALQHPNALNPDDSLSMANDSLISLSLTVTDKDGDAVSSSVDIASNLTFKDDGPHVEVTTLAEPILTVDETTLPTAIGPISFIDDFSFGFGADGPAAADSKAFTLSIVSGPSGLVDTATGNQVFLFLEAGQVVGREGTSLGDAASGDIVFTVSVNANGEVTLDQDRAVVHGDPTDPDEADTPATLSADDLIKLNMIVTDKDGDQASASINIGRNLHFEDDGPSATNEAQQDVNEGATKSGTFDFLTGNDGGGVTHINGTLLVFDGVTHWSQWIAVDDGQIRAMADGHYEFQANNNASGITSGTFTVTDGDGDPATANWAFNILDVGTPTAGSSTALADDDGLAGAAAGGTNDIDANVGEVAVVNPSEAVFHGDLNADFGSDGAGTISFAEMVGQFRMVGTERVHFTWDNATLTLRAIVDATDGVNPQARAGTELFKVVLDPSLNGNYTLTLEDNVLHAAGGNDETSAPNVQLLFHIVDSDNSPAGGAGGQLNITFNDDMPTLGVSSGSEPTLTVDDTTLATNASGSFAGVLGGSGASYGADGAGTTVYALHVGAGGVASGLFDVATGNQIYLYDVGGTIVGKVGSGVATPNASGATSFTVSVDSNGLVTLDQVLAIQHSPDSGPDQSTSIATDSLISLSLTITDADGDAVSSSVNIASNLVFKDDAPHLGAASGSEPTLTVDDTTLATNASGSFAGVLGAAGAGYGADGAGTTVYALHVGAGGVASGLFDVATGNQIYLYDVGGTIVGKVGSGVATPNASGATSFTVTVDSNGLVTLDQVLAIQHSPDSGPDQSTSMATDSLISLSLTITDKDGDAVSSSVNIASNLVFKDDAPHLGAASGSEPTLTVDDTTLATNASGSFAGVLGASGAGYGADGAGTTVYALHVGAGGVASGLFDVATGNQIYLYDVGGTIVGKVGSGVATPNPAGATSFTVTVDSNGLVTLDQQLAIQHSPDSGPDQSTSMATDSLISLSLTITDKDGDAVSSSVNIASNLVFKDDAPHVGASSGSEPTLTVDDTTLATNASGSFAGVLGLAGSGYGADGAGTTAFVLTVAGGGVASGLFDVATGNQIYLYDVGGTITGKVGSGVATPNPAGATAFTVSVDSNGLVTLDQVLAIQHSPDTGPDQSVSMANDNLITLNLVVTDKDGDVASSSVGIAGNLVFKDDAPTAVSAAAITTGHLTNGTGSASANLDGGAGGDSIVSNNFGADGAGKVIFTTATTDALTNQHYKHGGTELSYLITNGGQTLTGFIDTTPNGVVDAGETVFTIQLQTGVGGNEYTITMNQTIDTTQTVNFTDTLFDFIGGNKGWFGIVPNGQAPGDTPVDDDSHDLLITPTNDTSINTSGILGGVDTGQSVGVGEGFRIDYVVDLTGTPPNNFTNGNASGAILNSGDPVSEANHWYTNGATVTMRQSTGSDVKFTAYNDTDNDQIVGDGTIDTITKIVITYTNSSGTGFSSGDIVRVDNASHNVTLNGVTFSYQFNLDGTVDVHNVQGATGANDNPATTVAVYTDTNAGFVPSAGDPLGFDSLVVTNIGGDDFKFAGFGAVTTTAAPLDLSVPISIVDKDGDVVSSGNLAIHADAATPPVVLDLNGDGVHFLSRDAGVNFDYGAGLVSTAWAASDDGILVRDANHDGNVTGTEIVFGGNGVTDMEALHAQYGAQLDASDADFTQFAVWNDANSNGVVDANELHSLAEAGITSINLVSDGIAYTAANGDVGVAGTSTYTKSDGSTGQAADASFSTGSAKATQEVERVAANSNSTALAAAVAAAGVAASSAAAATAPSFGVSEAAISAAIVGKVAYAGDASFDSGSHFSALSSLSSGGFEASSFQLAGTSHTAIAASHIGELTSAFSIGNGPGALLDATDFGGAMHLQAMPTAMAVGMPSIHALVASASGMEAATSSFGIQHTGQVQQIVADALHGGGSGGMDINALLNALPGAGLGDNAGLNGLATQIGHDVPTWDMGHAGAFTFGATNIMTQPMVLHHDAVQPVVHG
ncbi:DUF5801 repeats-in-toxin domain-containing protein [Sphingomonas alba]|uniref:DUF5801 domain-containing protein n=1 Tax=Sphingomonas alba TaxID=2908208 RepID=A0ABT0RQG6_9SPHN|nr:DUF5801 repeats-in-toxin domain-containing protein [Sphingomonas alba]MCL6684793.1 DUF5801 domain-containing protein [Sphingomonas alba]